MKKILYSGITLFIILSIIYLSLTSRNVGLPVTNMDKVQHGLAYGVLAFFLTLSVRSWGIQKLDLLLSVILCAVLGGALEIIQSRYGRMMELNDFIADVAGAVMGSLILRISIRFSAKATGSHTPDRGDSRKV